MHRKAIAVTSKTATFGLAVAMSALADVVRTFFPSIR